VVTKTTCILVILSEAKDLCIPAHHKQSTST
jgi:hypothetical protein